MPRESMNREKVWLFSAIAIAASALPAHGAVYPTNTCVGQKLNAAAVACRQVFTAWTTWERNPAKDAGSTKLNAAIATAEQKLAKGWANAEQAATAKGVDCADTTVTSDAMNTTITTAVSDIVATINGNGGTPPANQTDRLCFAKVINAAGSDCLNLLKAESSFVKNLKKDPGGSKRTTAQLNAQTKFAAAWTKAACATGATAPDIANQLSTVNGTAVTDTTVSPNVPTAWKMISPPPSVIYNKVALTPTCSDGSPYVYFAKHGTENKLLVYYYGGGACWDYLTCAVFGQYTKTTGPQASPANLTPSCVGGTNANQACQLDSDCPSSTCNHGGFLDLTNPGNPFANWNLIAVPYCTGDVHWGNATVTYQDPNSAKTITIHHKGFVNAQVVEKWAREHFVNPDVLVVAGSSAGGYGALLNSLYLLQNVYQASQSHVFDDAGSGVITSTFQDNNLAQWGIQSSLPKWIPALNKPITQLSVSQVGAAAANFYPATKFAQYATAWDDVQTMFYNLMLYGASPKGLFDWWLSTCDWHSQMRSIVLQTASAAATNYRYFIGAGSRHTVWEFDKVYTDTTGSVPLIMDWLNAMLSGSANWNNVECTDCDLEPDDERPNPLQPPFGANGAVTCP